MPDVWIFIAGTIVTALTLWAVTAIGAAEAELIRERKRTPAKRRRTRSRRDKVGLTAEPPKRAAFDSGRS